MNPYQFPVTCDVCGGEGVGTSRTNAAAWDARSTIVHTNPADCRYYLDKKRRELEKQIEQMAESLKAAIK